MQQIYMDFNKRGMTLNHAEIIVHTTGKWKLSRTTEMSVSQSNIAHSMPYSAACGKEKVDGYTVTHHMSSSQQ